MNMDKEPFIMNFTYVKSWRMTLAGLKGISTSLGAVSTQLRIFSTSLESTLNSSQFLIADSNRMRIE
jgi:hypothetical protein